MDQQRIDNHRGFVNYIADGGRAYYSSAFMCNEWVDHVQYTEMFLDGAALCVLRNGYVPLGVHTSLQDSYARVTLDSIEIEVEPVAPGELELLNYLSGEVQRIAREALAQASTSASGASAEAEQTA